MKVVTVVGTRPEIIRLSRVIHRLELDCEHVLVHTGQNWDPQLSDVFFKELAIRQPDHWLEVPVTSLGAVLGGVLSRIEPVLVAERPDAVLVLGDTNSCIAAVMAKRMGIPVFHMEAGNRCFDENVPEETNRRLIDHVADFNLCYTEHARRNLLAEGLPTRRIFVTGSPMAEVIAAYDARIAESDVLERLGLKPGGYYLVSMHREENVDDPAQLDVLVEAISGLAERDGKRVVVSTHPRLRKRLEGRAGEAGDRLEWLEPFGYFDYNQLQRNARCVLSDSGTISEESAISGFPAVTIRNAIERPEALDTGSIVITGIDAEAIARAVDLVVAQWAEGIRPSVPADYQITDTSIRVSRLVCGLAGVHGNWLGLRSKQRLSDA
ncbi:MAG TPA: UDP-N-acetylglucosamine 2-epimerase (non-hydrolyzing) [Acidimicrobiales bacterium]|nr:UDP-N-acetylglucosamine 2-epimerase (non-hydrolyzing) [Acidimicrobiales bacterium]